MTWKELLARGHPIRLYAGDVPASRQGVIGLSLSQSGLRHIRHDISTVTMPLPDGSLASYQSEDVFEHIEYGKLAAIIDEIHRVLEPSGLFRLSVPDYRCDILIARSLRNAAGDIVFDPEGGGALQDGRVVGGGHLWFPRFESVQELLARTRFATRGTIEFLHYYAEGGRAVTTPIDYTKGFIARTPDHDERVQRPYRPMSIVVDLTKA